MSYQFVFFDPINNERFITSRQNAAVNLYSPIPERCPNGLDLALNGFFNGRQDGPGLPDLEPGEYGIMLDVIALKFMAFPLATFPRIPKTPSIANF